MRDHKNWIIAVLVGVVIFLLWRLKPIGPTESTIVAAPMPPTPVIIPGVPTPVGGICAPLPAYRKLWIDAKVRDIVGDSLYNPEQRVLHKYMDYWDLKVTPDRLTFQLQRESEAGDGANLASDLLHLAAIVSCRSSCGNWGLERIELVDPGPEGSSATFYLSGNDEICDVAENPQAVHSALQVSIDWAGLAPVATAIAVQQTPVAPAAQPTCPGGCTHQQPGCAIKGNVEYEGDQRIYHLQGCEDYDKTLVNPGYGDRWFCTEAEAQASGWRRAKNCP